jgi:hypothetical protein
MNCFLDIQAGAGGTEACDWASMLLRQYLKYAERKGFKTTIEDETAGRHRRHQGRHHQDRGRIRLWPAAHRDRRAPPGAQVAVRLLGRPPHQLCQRVCLPRDRRLDRDRHQPGRRAHRHLPRQRRRRPAHQQDRLGGAPDPHPHRHRGAVPGRPQPAQQPRRGLEAPARRLYDHEMRKRRKSSKSSKTARPTSAGATRSAATCWTTAASRTCAPTSRFRPRRRCWTATSMCSSKPRSSRVSDGYAAEGE